MSWNDATVVRLTKVGPFSQPVISSLRMLRPLPSVKPVGPLPPSTSFQWPLAVPAPPPSSTGTHCAPGCENSRRYSARAAGPV